MYLYYQEELWDIWCSQLQVNGGYRGILQWPTGSGKTFAELILIVLTASMYKSRGEVYRAVIIAPTNDILNTQMKHLRKIENFGIKLYEGHNGRLSSLTLPEDESFLLVTTHASFTNASILETLPPINHIHYDEVHRITGKELFTNLKQWMSKSKWGTQYLTGTSATPLTSNPTQREKVYELFGRDFPTIHRVDINTLVRLGYIAKPKIYARVIENGSNDEISAIEYINYIITERQTRGMWRYGKAIVYLPTLEKVRSVYDMANELFPRGWKKYMAINSAPPTCQDRDFVTDPADGIPRILFACEKYREGSDIQGIEFTMPLMGRTMSAHTFIQVMGRALRPDYNEKEGWCCVLRPQYNDETVEDVLDNIIINITSFLTINSTTEIPKKEAIQRHVTAFIGNMAVGDRVFDIEETTRRIQRMYIRQTTISYDKMKELNRELNLTCLKDYHNMSVKHPYYIENPKEHYNESWTNAYDFVGVDTSNWPSTKTEWKSKCVERGLTTWSNYKKIRQDDLPPNPSDLYNDFTSWRDEFPESYIDDW
jgi:superfamily II DNA or RNA helicase